MLSVKSVEPARLITTSIKYATKNISKLLKVKRSPPFVKSFITVKNKVIRATNPMKSEDKKVDETSTTRIDARIK